jgi:hypothetical protein
MAVAIPRFMRLTAFVCLSSLIACGGEPPPAHTTAQAETQTPAPVPAPAASAPVDNSSPPPTPVEKLTIPPKPNDLTDPTVDAICAARAKAAPLGTFTADASLSLDGATDIVVDDSFNSELRLVFQWPGTIQDMEGALWRTDKWTDVALTLPDSDDAAAGKSTLVYAFNDPMSDQCTDIAQTEDMAAGGCGSFGSSGEPPPAPKTRLTITARTDKTIEGTVDIQETDFKGKITFKAPLKSALPAKEDVCCLKTR